MKRPYKVLAKYNINKNTIKKFIKPRWQRDFRNTHIQKIMKSLDKGQHFSEPITINRVGDNNLVINGNHRIESIKRHLLKNPTFSIIASLIVYDNLDAEEQKQIYSIINNVKPESLNDFLKANLHDAFIVKELMRKFPVNIGFSNRSITNTNYINIWSVLKVYLQRNNKVQGIGNRYKYVSIIKEMDEEDHESMIKFFEFMMKVFGKPTGTNYHYTFTKMTVYSKVYYGANKSHKQLVEKMKYVYSKYNSHFMVRPQNYNEMKLFYETVLSLLNGSGIVFRDKIDNIYLGNNKVDLKGSNLGSNPPSPSS